jgi:thermitase
MKTRNLKRGVAASVRPFGPEYHRTSLGLMRLSLLTVAMLLLFFGPVPVNADPKNGGAEAAAEFAPGVLMVKFAEGVKARVEDKGGSVATGISSIDALNRNYGVEEYIKVFSPEPKSERGRSAYRELGLDRVYRFAAPPEADVRAMVAAYEADPNVEYAEPDYVGHGHYTPNDPSFNVQWGLCNTGSNPPSHPGTADADVDATEVWDSWTVRRGCKVAILDTGVDIDHPDLRHPFNPWEGNISFNYYEIFGWQPGGGIPGFDDDGNGYVDDCWGFDFVNGTQSGGVWYNDADGPMDDHGHGTVNAGIAGARTDNGVGVAGLAGSPGPLDHVWILAVKVLDNNNWGLYSWWAEGLYYAADNYARVINMSMGGTGSSTTLKTAVDYAWSQGCVVVAAMGNGNSSTPEIPAVYSNTIAVGATDTDDTRCDPADWGTGCGSNFGPHIDVVAPGNWIYSTAWNDTYAYWSGTSMAAPFVSGLAALLMMLSPGTLSPNEIRDIIRSTAEDQVGLPSEDILGWDQYYGWGRINACAAHAALPVAGDPNGDHTVDLGDVIYILNYLYKGGPAPSPTWTGDANSDGVVDLGDAIYILNYLYKGGPAPCSGNDGTSPDNAAKLVYSSGQAQISLRMKSDPAEADQPSIAKAARGEFEEVSEILVVGRFDQNVAGVHLEIEFDPDQVTLLNPSLTPFSSGLQLFAGVEDGALKMGMVDLSGDDVLPTGEGTLVRLQAKGRGLSTVRIRNAMLLDEDGMKLSVQIGSELEIEAAKESESTPHEFQLGQNYPNPFNPQTSIIYSLPEDGHVKLIVYNIAGQKVKTLVDDHQSSGHKTVQWDGKDENGDPAASGIYLYRIDAGEFSEVKKMMLVK